VTGEFFAADYADYADSKRIPVLNPRNPRNPRRFSLALSLMLLSQDYTQRGFVETRATVYAEKAPNDSAHVVGEAQVRYEGFYKPRADFQIAGALDLRTDTHRQTEREWRFDWKDRGRQRPALSLRRLSAQYYRGGFTLEAGKQFIRWGRTDIVNPTDRFAPRDFLTVVDNEFLGIAAVRATYERGPNTVEVVWSPRLTPSRVPLLTQRWFVPPAGGLPAFTVIRRIPEGSQTGVRWSYAGPVEFAAAYYSGFSHVPSYEPIPGQLAVREFYPEQQMVGGDIGIPLRWVSIKAEAGHFSSADPRSDEHVLYVVQLERQSGEWFFVGGYGGDAVTTRGTQSGDFNPDRGMTRTILGRAGYTIDTNRSIAFETAIRDNGDGLWAKTEYSQAFGQHWRLTAGVSLIRGEASDFLGQYRRNSHGLLAVKYSF
jgi:hypothetical protein